MKESDALSSFRPANDLQVSFWEHLEDLRRTGFKIIATIAIGTVLSLLFYSSALHLLLSPLSSEHTGFELHEVKYRLLVNRDSSTREWDVPHEEYAVVKMSPGVLQKGSHTFTLPPDSSLEISFTEKPHRTALLSPLEGMQTTLKICFWTGVAISSPLWLWFIGQFVFPALHAGERKLLLPFLLLSGVFSFAGALFAYLVTLPLTNAMLFAFNAEIGINLWSFSRYIDYTFLLLLANALAFEISLLLFFCVHIGLFGPQSMKAKRRHVILGAFVIGALLTPPDVFTQVMLALPLIGLYEISILYARFRSVKRSPAG